jgi:hypothetical protein
MGKVTNLRTVRKQTAREEKRATGSENAAKHGTSKAARVLQAAREEQRVRKLDAHKIDED